MIWLKKNQIQNKQYYCSPRNRQLDDWIDHNSTEVGLTLFSFSYSRESIKQMVLALLAIHSEGNKNWACIILCKKIPYRLKKGDTEASEEKLE